MKRANPSISQNEKIAALDESDTLNLRSAGHRIAFNAENFDFELLNEERYIRYMVLVIGLREGEYFEQPV